MIEFLGKTYANEKEWARAFPAYGRSYSGVVAAGAKTPLEIEVEIWKRRNRALEAGKVGQAALRKAAARKVLQA